MAEQLAKAHQYEYRATANLVLQADRCVQCASGRPRPPRRERSPGQACAGWRLARPPRAFSRSLIGRRTDEGTGEPESLSGRINPKMFGDRAMRSAPNIDKARQRYEPTLIRCEQ